ncbi:right-handed parallel beta-helix repeat-containing protein [Luteolibacter luteus]|uniref:Right handed beta helix domain-containing protein n=1 Tax=Luteolibacter luteus TaxID=2728835 RepID=A0A858RNT3_9BACT|nr:right-handed parallel beta-helix repeat-containing protein [Luteolibacter luteus]QJE98395.1 hypothetical protein HHL09_22270 [Luteolibacter luteus]
MTEFAAARERIAELVRTAPNETIALRYQDGLIDFDRALAAIREDMEKEDPEVTKRNEWMLAAKGSEAPAFPEPKNGKAEEEKPEPEQKKKESGPEPEPPVDDSLAEQEFEHSQPADKPASRGLVGTLFIIFLLALAGGGIAYTKFQEHEKYRARERLTFLERLGARMVEARRWDEANLAYKEIEELDPKSEIAVVGRRSIEAGMEEEQRQFVGYWSGQALAEFEAGRLDEAAAAAQKVLDRYPGQKEVTELFNKIEQSRSTAAREALVAATTAAIQKRRWDDAEAKAAQLASAFPGDPEGNVLLSEIRAGREKEAREKARAQELFAAAKGRDQGTFDGEAMEWLREATALAPDDSEIAALYKKMTSYTRTLQVPGDFSTLNEAIAAARDRDRISVGEGTWTGPIIVDKAITLEGAGRDKTIVEVEAVTSTAATFGRKSSGTQVSGITFRHRGFDPGLNRFSALLIRGAEVVLSDCRVADSAGHGLAVMEAGRVSATRCLFENNGWDGVAVRGAGSRVELSECEATGNFGHGFDLWEGGTGAIHNSVARDNSGNGILVDTNGDNVVLGNNDLRGNREYGIVAFAGVSGRIHGNQCRENLLGGMAVRFAAERLAFENNKLEKNLGPGLALEQGLKETSFATNSATGNSGGKNTVTNADFSSGE